MPQGVPDTDNFAMSDVVTEIGSGDDLGELFGLATGTFDPAYEGDRSNLLNFRNYAHTAPAVIIPFGPKAPDIADGWVLANGATIIGGVLTLPVGQNGATIVVNQENAAGVIISFVGATSASGIIDISYDDSSTLIPDPFADWLPPVKAVGLKTVVLGAKDAEVTLTSFGIIYV